jgi:xanthine dehydrogenase accessory factor
LNASAEALIVTTMKEISDILREYEHLSSAGKKAALATVVKVEGSSYRQPGARMLIAENGSLTGAISGGCLEGDAMRRALLVIARGTRAVVTYDTTDEDDAKLGIGLGCNGIIDILIEPIDADNPANPVQLLRTLVNTRQPGVLITLFNTSEPHRQQAGSFFAYTQNGKVLGSAPAQLQDELQATAREALERLESRLTSFSFNDLEFSAFVEVIRPVIHLVIAGAGNDVMPLVSMAGLLAWQVTVLDNRSLYATCARFPDVHQVLVTDAEEALKQIVSDDNTVFVLMTHNYNYDLALLRQLLNQKSPYIGVLGPKKKFNRLMDELGVHTTHTTRAVDNLFGPVGLDIGAETAEEIALSVMAEIKAVLTGKEGKFLRDKKDAIHSPLLEIKEAWVHQG